VSIIPNILVYVAHPCSALAASSIQRNNLSKSKSKTPQILDKTKALVIVEKQCYISQINLCYGNPSLDPSKPNLPHLDCITAGHRLPCSLCLLQQGGGTIAFSPLSPEGVFPLLTPLKSAIVSKLHMKKKDTLNKKEQVTAEKHLLEFGNFIRQMEQHSDSHKYHPHSSYFPLDVSSSYWTTCLSFISLPTSKMLLAIHGSRTAPMELLSMTLLLIFRHRSMLGTLMPENLLNQSNMEKDKWQWLLRMKMKLLLYILSLEN